jgi:hypothetical protein
MARWLHADNYSLCTLLLFYVKAFADKAKYPGSIVAKLEVFAELKTISIKKSGDILLLGNIYTYNNNIAPYQAQFFNLCI